MTTQQFPDVLTEQDASPSETPSASPSSDGSGNASVQSMHLMGDYYREADPVYLCMAIVLVHQDFIEQGRKPGKDTLLYGTRSHRAELVNEIETKWYDLTDEDRDEGVFPYHSDYVIRQWVAYRKLSQHVKAAWLRETQHRTN